VTTHDDDSRLIRFLLGDIDEPARQAIERQVLEQDGMTFAELVALEDELRFEYLQERLSRSDRVRFEERYLQTASHRRDLAFAKALLQRASEAVAASRGSAVRRARRAHRPWRAWPIALAAAAVILAAATGWLAALSYRQHAEIRQLLTTAGRAPEPPRPAPAPTVALVLVPGLTRGAGSEVPRVSEPDAAAGLALSLTLPAESGSFPSYAVDLVDPDGHRLWTADRLVRSALTVPVRIPHGLLFPQDFEIVLHGVGPQGERHDLASYYFRVVAR
jgi:hypothetical protein